MKGFCPYINKASYGEEGMTLTQLIKKGKFDFVNDNITDENFPLIERKVGEAKLYRFDRTISSDDAIVEMQKDGYLPATLPEMLEWDGWNRRDVVLALGTILVVGDKRQVTGLEGSTLKCGIAIGRYDYEWDDWYRFLAFRNLDQHG